MNAVKVDAGNPGGNLQIGRQNDPNTEPSTMTTADATIVLTTTVITMSR